MNQTPEEESLRDSLGLRELKDMLAETKADEELVLRIIEEAMLEPIPDPNDEEACEEFAHKMSILRDLANTYLGRSEMLLEIQRQLDEKSSTLDQLGN